MANVSICIYNLHFIEIAYIARNGNILAIEGYYNNIYCLRLKREMFDKVFSFFNYRQIIIFFGLRRAGKTTLMYQIIDYLLKKEAVDPFNVLYFSFDEQDISLNQLLETYQQDILKKGLGEQERIYLFLDEVQKLDDWFNKVKIIYDRAQIR